MLVSMTKWNQIYYQIGKCKEKKNPNIPFKLLLLLGLQKLIGGWV